MSSILDPLLDRKVFRPDMEPCIFEPGGLLRDGEYMAEVGCDKGKVLRGRRRAELLWCCR